MDYKIFETCVFFPGVSPVECASWVQAWGTILAVCAAIFIAWWQRSEERRHARELDMAKGLVVADTVLYAMVNASANLCALGDSLKACQRGERVFLPTPYVEALQQLQMPSDEELLGIAPCWPTGARYIAEARARVKFALVLLSGLTRYGVFDEKQATVDLPQITRTLFEGHFLLIEAHRVIRPEDLASERPSVPP